MPRKRKKPEILGFDPKSPEKTAKPQRRVLGTAKVQRGYRLTLIKRAREKLNAETGDTLIFGEDEEGKLIIKIIKAHKKPKHT